MLSQARCLCYFSGVRLHPLDVPHACRYIAGMTQINPEEIPALDEPPVTPPAEAPAAIAPEPAALTDVAPETTEAAEAMDAADTTQMPLPQVLEALLFSSDVPLSLGKLAETVGLDSTKPVKAALEGLNKSYEERQAAFRIEERAGGMQLLTLPQYGEYVERLVRKKDEGRLTPASLETLAIIAYKQPILRVDVEAIRGVACGEVIRTLMEHNLVKIVGRAEVIGRPMLYGTTRYFLEVFGLANIRDLPKAEMLKEPK